ncbi:hypothetical protein [Sphingobacterium haloxyli]|uniref:Uncharacterized protein n=1 Tax=Sphingobacterium haloxyli TaxID=2100533 RepID=A0A2S9J0K7_9SPHI|nr:hypothetical protein [Sphingobacterium haloxyli]PRD46319.1 hypothetical protein C5745_16175 [Sphingobacterium haloxyli]
MRYFYILFVALAICTSCEKGEVVNSYTPFTTLFIENYENSYKIEIDGHKYASGSIKVPVAEGENAFTLYNGDDEMQFEGSFRLKPDRDTLVLFKINEEIPVALMRKEDLNEPKEEGRLKFRIVNSNSEIAELTNGEPFHLVFYQVLEQLSGPPARRKVVYHEEGDTVFNITNQLPESYQIIDITDNMESPFGFRGRAQILKEDFSPVMVEGVEVFVTYNSIDINKGAHILYLQEATGSLYSFFPNIEPYWEFSVALQSAYSN